LNQSQNAKLRGRNTNNCYHHVPVSDSLSVEICKRWRAKFHVTLGTNVLLRNAWCTQNKLRGFTCWYWCFAFYETRLKAWTPLVSGLNENSWDAKLLVSELNGNSPATLGCTRFRHNNICLNISSQREETSSCLNTLYISQFV